MFTPLLHATRIPPARELPVGLASRTPDVVSTWPKGAVLVETTGTFVEAASPVTLPASHISAGISGVDSHVTGYSKMSEQTIPPNLAQGFPIRDHALFAADYTGTLPSVLGSSFGVVKDTDGEWKVDFDDTTNHVVYFEAWGTSQELGAAVRKRVVVYFMDEFVLGDPDQEAQAPG